MNDIFLLLGSNLGSRELFLEQAIDHIEADIAPVVRRSSVFETQSWGKTDEPDYLNQVVQLHTTLPARELLGKILAIEILLGRERKEKWGARIIDIDILFYGDAIINEPDLRVPHPELHKRRFTLEPLAEIAANFVHPVLHKDVLQLKNDLKDDLVVKKI
jgi:2-amino-4-hydroxy-6-hydroxymethyldihydropteridine diphosphokinase